MEFFVCFEWILFYAKMEEKTARSVKDIHKSAEQTFRMFSNLTVAC